MISSDNFKRSTWYKLPAEERSLILRGVLDSLLNHEGVSIEQSIQRCIDAFQCDHQDVIDALKDMSEEQKEGR
jgi:hypothetical protein